MTVVRRGAQTPCGSVVSGSVDGRGGRPGPVDVRSVERDSGVGKTSWGGPEGLESLGDAVTVGKLGTAGEGGQQRGLLCGVSGAGGREAESTA